MVLWINSKRLIRTTNGSERHITARDTSSSSTMYRRVFDSVSYVSKGLHERQYHFVFKQLE